MKQYFTGFFTGVCLVVSSVMFMGAGQSNSKVGKYAVYVSFGVEYLIDTETGKMKKKKSGVGIHGNPPFLRFRRSNPQNEPQINRYYTSQK